MRNSNALITYGLYPATFVAELVFAYYAMQAGLPEPLIILLVTISAMVITAAFERIQPIHPNWNKPRNDVKTDVCHLLVSMVVLPELLEAALRAGFLVLAISLAPYLGADLWPTGWPLVLQLLLAMAISQFGEYWVHRAMHEVPWLWPYHAVHHSPGRLYWLNAARFHPVDIGIDSIVALTPLLLLGVPDQVMVLVTVWVAVHGLFQHCNVDIKLGPLNYIFSQAELHRWHHSLVPEEANTNYGNNIIFWDIVFGTMYYPKDRVASEHIGLHGLDNFPGSYWQQLMAPFRWREITRNSLAYQGSGGSSGATRATFSAPTSTDETN